jgi:hypothetical protein
VYDKKNIFIESYGQYDDSATIMKKFGHVVAEISHPAECKSAV